MKRVFTGLILLGLFVHGQARSPYSLSWKKEAVVLGTSAFLGTKMILTDPSKGMINEGELFLLDPRDVNRFDRGAIGNWSETANHLSDIGLFVPAGMAALSPLVLPGAGKSDRFVKDAGILAVLWLESNLLNLGLTDLVKTSAGRVRPYAYSDHMSLEEKLGDEDMKRSFFSRHVSVSAVNSFFLAKVISDYYPDSRWKGLTWGLAAAVPAFTAYLRVSSGEHFPTDVIAGYAVGALVGYLIPRLHLRKMKGEEYSLNLMPYRDYESSGLRLFIHFN